MKTKTIRKTVLPALLTVVLLPLAAEAETSLWKATSDRGTFYLQGSIHLLKASDYPLDPAIEKAYAASDVLIFETDIGKMLTPESQQLLLQKALLPAGQTLKDALDPEVYAALAEKLNDSELPPAALQQFKPWFATTTLMVLRMEAMGMNPNLGLDQYLHRKAEADQKKQVGLETIEFQINLFDMLSKGNQSEYTKHALAELEQMETMLNDIVGAWKKGRLEKLNELMTASFNEYPDMYEQFVTARNKDWAKKLDAMAEKDTTGMVVVGAAHLAGEQGLIALMKDKGYSIEQL